VNIPLLARRSELLQRVREFFLDRNFVEVETPLVDQEIIPEAHIDPLEVAGLGWLQASPEMHIKRLLCEGTGPVFQIGKCFRAGEHGTLHSSEFTMIEWYRPGDTLDQGIDLVNALLVDVAATPPLVRTSYRAAFLQHARFDPHTATLEQLVNSAVDPQVATTRDEWLNYWLVKRVEPALGLAGPEVIYHYPPSQASLAALTTDSDGMQVAQRFELYWHGVELANGFHELTDAVELRARLEQANDCRRTRGLPPLPLPERLLEAIASQGLPATTGVALGFDRLAMLVLEADSIDEVMWGGAR
jgi:elongation factor P--(R)-beta-lysine ligase